MLGQNVLLVLNSCAYECISVQNAVQLGDADQLGMRISLKYGLTWNEEKNWLIITQGKNASHSSLIFSFMAFPLLTQKGHFWQYFFGDIYRKKRKKKTIEILILQVFLPLKFGVKFTTTLLIWSIIIMTQKILNFCRLTIMT